MDVTDLKQEVGKVKWFHTIDLGNGIITPGIDDTPSKLKRLHLPRNLEGMSVLDIGAFDGFFSFEAERRGASRVVAADNPAWTTWATKKAGFDLAKRVFRSTVEEVDIDVMDLSPTKMGVFDLVLFLGVLYHLRHPLLALERLFSVTGKQLILETHVDLITQQVPAMAFYPRDELNGDPSNWWGPNPSCVKAMLRDVGFAKVQEIADSDPPWQTAVRVFKRGMTPFVRRFQQSRAVFHAWK